MCAFSFGLCVFAVKILVQYGADINAPDSFHSTPLVTAVCFGHEGISLIGTVCIIITIIIMF